MNKPPPQITPRYVDWCVQRYLERWSTTRAHLRRLLMRRVDRSLAHHGGERADAERTVDEVLDRYERAGALDDEAFTKARVRRLVRKGVSERGIQARMAALGADRAVVNEAVDAVAPDPNLAAACAYVRKRRMGPYRDPSAREAARDKDLARLGRAGFPYGVARAVLEMDVDAIEDQLID